MLQKYKNFHNDKTLVTLSSTVSIDMWIADYVNKDIMRYYKV